MLFHHRSRLGSEALRLLHRHLELNVPFMSTEDLKIHGYNDNHPFKAMHVEDAPLVRIGRHKLRQAISGTVFPVSTTRRIILRYR
ncbi:MAG: hypothetical protein HKL95_06635 [Phycisphaerae bacterium]|nr:hypothetical protein [Phycisphaerae bacterium]